MLKRRESLLRFLPILGQAGVLGELLTDQNDMHKVILWDMRVLFLHFAVYTITNGSCMPSHRPWRLDMSMVIITNLFCAA